MFRSVIFPDKDWFQILKIDSPYISEINPMYQQWKNHLIIQIIHFLGFFFKSYFVILIMADLFKILSKFYDVTFCKNS